MLTAGTIADAKAVYRPTRRRHGPLLGAGVRIYEDQPSTMHPRTLVADGARPVVGSMTFDERSPAPTDECSIVALDLGVGATLDAKFRDGLRYARAIWLRAFARGPVRQRAVEIGAALMSPILRRRRRSSPIDH